MNILKYKQQIINLTKHIHYILYVTLPHVYVFIIDWNIYQNELSECRVSEGRDGLVPEVEAEHPARADLLCVRGVEGVTETVVPSPEVVDVRGPPLLIVGQVGGTGGMEDLPGTIPPTQTPPVDSS